MNALLSLILLSAAFFLMALSKNGRGPSAGALGLLLILVGAVLALAAMVLIAFYLGRTH